MAHSLQIAPHFRLPIDAATQTFGILGKRGGGKSYTAKVMAEEMIKAGVHVCAVDPIGNWWGLRAGADGKSPGLPITVLGGEYGDIPLEATEKAGELVARLIIEEKISAVLDLSLFRKGEQTSFMIGWAETLYRLNREALHLFIDEADAWAPQRPVGNLAPRLLGAMEDLVRRGRARGLGMTMITQRSASINKDLLTQIEVLIAKRTIAPQDREAIEAWVRVHGTAEQKQTLMESLPSLPKEDAWFWSPSWLDLFKRITVRKLETFDSSATPEVGKKRVEPRKLAEADLAVLRDRMAATIEKAKAEDPRELRKIIADRDKRIREMERQPAGAGAKGAVDPEALKLARDAGAISVKSQLARELRKYEASIDKLLGGVRGALNRAAAELQKGGELFDQARPSIPSLDGILAAAPNSTAPTIVLQYPSRTPEEKRQSPKPGPESHSEASEVPDGGKRRMLTALAQCPDGLSARQLGTRAVLSSKGGTFTKYLGQMRTAGWIEGERSFLRITDEGRQALGSFDPLPTGPDLLEYWTRELGDTGMSRMLRVLAEHGGPMAAELLGELSGVEAGGGTFTKYLGKLRTLELVEGGRNDLRASKDLF